MSVKNIMSSSVVAVDMDDALGKVKKLFEENGFHHLLVTQSGRLMGVISDRDLLKSISHNVGTVREKSADTATLKKRVHQIMTRKPISVEPSASIYEAVAIFNEHKISCIPVVDEQNRPVGIISWRDIIRVLEKQWGAESRRAATV